MTFPLEPGDHLYEMRRLPSQLPWHTDCPKWNCQDCRDTGTVRVTLYGVRDGDRYEQADEPCHCPLGQKSKESENG